MHPNEASPGCGQWPVQGGVAVEVLRSGLEVALTEIVLPLEVNWEGLEPLTAKREDEKVT